MAKLSYWAGNIGSNPITIQKYLGGGMVYTLVLETSTFWFASSSLARGTKKNVPVVELVDTSGLSPGAYTACEFESRPEYKITSERCKVYVLCVILVW